MPIPRPVHYPAWAGECNDFPQPCALMAALARIPLGKGGFTGCICSILYRGREYRFATYGGVRILKADAEQIRLAINLDTFLQFSFRE